MSELDSRVLGREGGMIPNCVIYLCIYLFIYQSYLHIVFLFMSSIEYSGTSGSKSSTAAAAAALQRNTSVEGDEYECGICMEDVPADDAFSLGCGHYFCRACWRDHLRYVGLDYLLCFILQ